MARGDAGPEGTAKGRRRMSRTGRLTPDVREIVEELEEFLDYSDASGRQPCAARCGVYAFFDYDDEPIYVGQTYEQLRVRIRRHLTNQRTDAVAMHVLDPMEVARVQVWPFWDLENEIDADRRKILDRAESTVYRSLLEAAHEPRLLNEKIPAPAEDVELPESYSGRIIPQGSAERLGHPDERIARRASTIANLAQVIKERDVSLGLRETLITQAQRLERLAQRRYEQVRGETSPTAQANETVGSDSQDENEAPTESN